MLSSWNLRLMRSSGSEGSDSKPVWQRAELADRGTVVPQYPVLGTWHSPIDSGEGAAPGSYGNLKRAIFKAICKGLLLSLLSHLLEAPHLECTGCVCGGEGAARKCSGLMLSSAVPTGIRKGHMQKSHPAWPLNLDKLSISCTGGTFFLHALV